jgi:replicative DNA helicase
MPTIEELRLPPHNLEAEKALLSSIFIDNEVMYTAE